jgi:hypothetical protein
MLLRDLTVQRTRSGEERVRVRPTDEQLLASADPEGFAAFYCSPPPRHRGLLRAQGRSADGSRPRRRDVRVRARRAAAVCRGRDARGRVAVHDRGAQADRFPSARERRSAHARGARLGRRCELAGHDGSVRSSGRPRGRTLASPAARSACRGRGSRPRGARLQPDRCGVAGVGGRDPPARFPGSGRAPRPAPRLPRRAGTRARGPFLPLRGRAPRAVAVDRARRAARLLGGDEPDPRARRGVRAGSGLVLRPSCRVLGHPPGKAATSPSGRTRSTSGSSSSSTPTTASGSTRHPPASDPTATGSRSRQPPLTNSFRATGPAYDQGRTARSSSPTRPAPSSARYSTK